MQSKHRAPQPATRARASLSPHLAPHLAPPSPTPHPCPAQDKIADKWIETAKADFSKGDERDALTMKGDVKANVAKAEMWHGRVAMLAITGFAVQEAVWGTPVVEQF